MGDIVIEQTINEFFGDADSTGFGTGWWSGILSAFFGFLSFGGVLCLHFPQLLSSPELRPHYPNAHHARFNPMPHRRRHFFRNHFFDQAQEKNFGNDWNVACHRGNGFGRIECTD
ncbi:MAG: hypothetical protein ABSF72_05935 [Candidatus Sulfotelmatobacter sp.]